MPINHGIHCKGPATSGELTTAANWMSFRYGILRIFDALRAGPFLAHLEDRQKAAQVGHDFRTRCQRFVFTLQQLNGLMQELANLHSPGEPPSHPSVAAIHFEAECLGDHVLTYLNTLIDDVANLIVIASGFIPPKRHKQIDSMGRLRRDEFRNAPAFAHVKTLLDETYAPGSWWDLGFSTGKGARQLIVHNQHLVSFQPSSAPGGPMEVWSLVTTNLPHKRFACRDFFGLLRDILSGLFGWLDRLESALASHLQAKAVGWSPSATCPRFLLPVGLPPGIIRYDKYYFPIPLCDGSDDLPWSVSVPAR